MALLGVGIRYRVRLSLSDYCTSSPTHQLSLCQGCFPALIHPWGLTHHRLCPICMKGRLMLLRTANQSACRHATLALRVQFRYNPCLNKGILGAAMAGCW